MNFRYLRLEGAKVQREGLVPVSMYGNDVMVWREKGRSRIRGIRRNTLGFCWI